MKLRYKTTILLPCFLCILQVAAQPSNGDLYNLDLEQLQDIKITIASKNEESQEDAAGVISVITRSELSRFGAISLRDALERVPSLNGTVARLTDIYGLSSRGDALKINSGHILFLINGRPARESHEGSVNSDILAAFPIDLLQRIEVIRGPGSVLYGSGAFSAVINLVTLDTETQKTGLNVRGNTTGASGMSGHIVSKFKELNFLVGGRFFSREDKKVTYVTANNDDPMNPFVDEIELRDQSYAGYLGLDYKKLNLMVSYNEYDATNFFRQAARLGETANWTKIFSNLGYQIKLTDNWDLDLNATHTKSEFDTEEVVGVSRVSNDAVFEFTNHITLQKKSYLLLGGLYNYNSGQEFNTRSNRYITDLSRGSFALYSQLDYQITPDVKFTGGVQANKVKNQDVSVVPRAGLIWKPIPSVSVKALYSEAYRAPSVNELGINSMFIKGDPNLRPETNKSIDLGVKYQSSGWMIGVNYFNSLHSDIIVLDFDVRSQSSDYRNLSEVRFNGVEFETIFNPNYRLFVKGSILVQENKNREGTMNSSPMPTYGNKLGVSYLLFNRLNISLFNIYQGGLSSDFVANRNPDYQPYNLLNGQLNFQLNQHSEEKKCYYHVHLQVDNLFNEEIWLPSSGQGLSTITLPYNVGRSLNVGLRMSLN